MDRLFILLLSLLQSHKLLVHLEAVFDRELERDRLLVLVCSHGSDSLLPLDLLEVSFLGVASVHSWFLNTLYRQISNRLVLKLE